MLWHGRRSRTGRPCRVAATREFHSELKEVGTADGSQRGAGARRTGGVPPPHVYGVHTSWAQTGPWRRPTSTGDPGRRCLPQRHPRDLRAGRPVLVRRSDPAGATVDGRRGGGGSRVLL